MRIHYNNIPGMNLSYLVVLQVRMVLRKEEFFL